MTLMTRISRRWPRCFASETRSTPVWGVYSIGPVNAGSIGEWIAAQMFDIELETAANVAGYDGHFTTGILAGRLST